MASRRPPICGNPRAQHLVYIVVAVVATVAHLLPLVALYALAVLLPTLEVEIRRLHDIDKSGWWILIFLVPFVGGTWLLVLLCLRGSPAENRFGPMPDSGVSLGTA
jgi:uncharacterized membrane protein YhaH (DUF805 family)